MVKIAPFRYLMSCSSSIPQGGGFKSVAGGFSRSPDSPRAIFELELETISPCSDIIPLPPHDSPSLASPETPNASSLVSDTPVVVLSSESFCTEHKVGLRNVQDFITSGLLREAPSKAFFIYSQTSGSHTQIGVCAALSVDDYEKGIVKKHENTIFDKEETEACNLFFENMENVDPVMVMYRRKEAINTIVDRIVRSTSPLLTSAPSSSLCPSSSSINAFSIWTIHNEDDKTAIMSAFSTVKSMYIADGHHRSAAALRNAEKTSGTLSNSKHFKHSGYLLAAMFPDDQLRILPFNRCVSSLGEISPEQFLHRLKNNFEVRRLHRSCKDPSPVHYSHEISMFFRKHWYSLLPRQTALVSHSGGTSSMNETLETLDPVILHRCLLAPVLGIHCPRSDKRLVYVCGDKGWCELERRVRSGEAAVAFLLRNVSVVQVMAVADAGHLLPPKATCFDPKPKTGLIIRLQ